MKIQFRSFILLVIIMTLGLTCACADNASLIDSSAPTDSTAPTETPSPNETSSEAPSSSVPVPTLDDIMSIIEKGNNRPDIPIMNITDIGTEWLLVEYDLQAYNEFLLYNARTGAYDRLSRNAKLLKAESENHLIFEIVGDWEEGGFLDFPYIEDCIRKAGSDDGTGYGGFDFSRITEFYELDRSVKGGSHEGDKLSVITATIDGFEALFKPADGKEGAGFWAAASYIPPTVTSYDKNANLLTIALEKCQLDSSVKTDVEIKTNDNGYMSSYKVTQKDGVIYITAKLRPVAAGYSIDTGKVPIEDNADGYPYLIVRFTNEDVMSVNRYT